LKPPISLGLPALTAGLLLTASSALAQPLHFNQVDDNRDGFLSDLELETALGSADLSADLILSLDQDEDGLLSRDEVRAAADSDDGGDDEGEDDKGDEDDDGEGEDDSDDGSQAGGFDRGEDGNHGHGDDEDGFDDDNPGQGHGDDGVPGGGRAHDNPDRGHRDHDDND
jgi:hypothetical protein